MAKSEKFRVNLLMPKPMLEELDLLSNELGANRTALINMIIRQYLDQREVVRMSKRLDEIDKQQLAEK